MSMPLTTEQEAAMNESGEEARKRRGKLANPSTYKEVSESDSRANPSQNEISIVSKSDDEAQRNEVSHPSLLHKTRSVMHLTPTR